MLTFQASRLVEKGVKDRGRRCGAKKRETGSPEIMDNPSGTSTPGAKEEQVIDKVPPARVGVFYCVVPVVGEILVDRCRELTARSHEDGSGIEYHFMTEVFE